MRSGNFNGKESKCPEECFARFRYTVAITWRDAKKATVMKALGCIISYEELCDREGNKKCIAYILANAGDQGVGRPETSSLYRCSGTGRRTGRNFSILCKSDGHLMLLACEMELNPEMIPRIAAIDQPKVKQHIFSCCYSWQDSEPELNLIESKCHGYKTVTTRSANNEYENTSAHGFTTAWTWKKRNDTTFSGAPVLNRRAEYIGMICRRNEKHDSTVVASLETLYSFLGERERRQGKVYWRHGTHRPS